MFIHSVLLQWTFIIYKLPPAVGHMPQYVTYISAHKTTQVMQPILCRDPNNIMCMRILIPLSTEGYGRLKNGRRYSPVNLPVTEDVLILSSSTLIHLASPCLHYLVPVPALSRHLQPPLDDLRSRYIYTLTQTLHHSIL